jgi:hypothetical protein
VSRGLEIGEKATNKVRRNIDYGETVRAAGEGAELEGSLIGCILMVVNA